LLKNVRQACRQNHLAEGALWDLEAVKRLVKAWSPPAILQGKKLRLKIIRCDETKPFTPENAQVQPVGFRQSRTSLA
jgi:hypothetical protein